MKRCWCIALCSIHVIAVAICTYYATIQITSILYTGWICSLTGTAAGIVAERYQRRLLAAACFLAPLMAIVLAFLEAVFLQLGPNKAALPFCIVFLVHQSIALLVVSWQLSVFAAPAGLRGGQVSIKTLMVALAGASVYLAIVRQLADRGHSVPTMLAIGLFGATLVGLCLALYPAVANRGALG